MFGFPITTTRSAVVAGIVWIAIMVGVMSQSACLRQDSCGGGDMFMMAIIALGMLVRRLLPGLCSAGGRLVVVAIWQSCRGQERLLMSSHGVFPICQNADVADDSGGFVFGFIVRFVCWAAKLQELGQRYSVE